ncbi:hypothetical protein [Bradyrhizobium archetypum]|uniref:Uncharacterized protein n=1 Tax=Bradyrhizobium archetypum TaxID=2721160 RepID=A0A7Y4HAT1_9BRAD|nr:hypothetical protein [Bradyrhizobium archetypum]NOJ50830.1 hypothetical protein [Bradyrhizobium archetypum]
MLVRYVQTLRADIEHDLSTYHASGGMVRAATLTGCVNPLAFEQTLQVENDWGGAKVVGSSVTVERPLSAKQFGELL